MKDPDYDQTESVFRRVNRVVWVVTAADQSRRGGLVATWVSQASLDRRRPVVLAGIAPNHFTSELIDTSGAFALHLISKDQISHAWNFAIGSGRVRDKLAGLQTNTATTGSPILRDCLAWLDCRVFARLNCGDRIFYWADVVASGDIGNGQPLTEQQLMAAATDEQKRQLLADRDADIQLQRPLHELWRSNLPDNLRPVSPFSDNRVD